MVKYKFCHCFLLGYPILYFMNWGMIIYCIVIIALSHDAHNPYLLQHLKCNLQLCHLAQDEVQEKHAQSSLGLGVFNTSITPSRSACRPQDPNGSCLKPLCFQSLRYLALRLPLWQRRRAHTSEIFHAG